MEDQAANDGTQSLIRGRRGAAAPGLATEDAHDVENGGRRGQAADATPAARIVITPVDIELDQQQTYDYVRDGLAKAWRVSARLVRHRTAMPVILMLFSAGFAGLIGYIGLTHDTTGAIIAGCVLIVLLLALVAVRIYVHFVGGAGGRQRYGGMGGDDVFDAAGGLDLTNPDIRRQVELAQAMARGGRGVPGFGPMMGRMDAQHMQLMRREGDFRPEDYERLLALDDGDTPTRRLRAASAMELSRLPVFRYSPPDAGREKPTKPPSLPPPGGPSTSGTSASGTSGTSASGTSGGAVAARGAPKSSSSPSSSLSASSKSNGNSRAKGEGEDESKGKCMVCLEHFEAGEQLKMLPCLHYFHEDCADKWLVEKAVCPVCMNSIRGEEEEQDGDTRALEARGAAAAAVGGAAPPAEGP